MKRTLVSQRPDWEKSFEALGFSFHSQDGGYWFEGVCYEFSAEEIDRLEAATNSLHAMCLEAVAHVIEKNLFPKLAIDSPAADLIKQSWNKDDLSIYGRFDLCYQPESGTIKLLEYNADTPTALYESSIAQWVWLEEMALEGDQFNSIHEKLVAAFQEIKKRMPLAAPMHFACIKEHPEDLVTTEYLRDAASQAGIATRHIFIEDIGCDPTQRAFFDLDDKEIIYLFKLYPWEWMIAEEFGQYVHGSRTHFFEPPWKLVLSSKGLLPILWDMHPGHPYLLPCQFDPPPFGCNHVKKPLFSREGANISIIRDGHVAAQTGGSYGEQGFVYQGLAELPVFDGRHAMIGSWVVGGESAGICIREDNGPITHNRSRFVPHYFKL